jgi:hypothetical protein
MSEGQELKNYPLNGHCQQIYDSRFLHQTIPPRALSNGLKPFRMWLCIHRENQ